MKFLSYLLDLLFPPKCVFCRRVLEHPESGSICPECEKTLPRTQNGGRQEFEFLDGVFAPLYYKGTVRDALRRYKFNALTLYAPTFVSLLADTVKETTELQSADFITWVPLSAKRLKERGYDQAQLLAEKLSESCHLPLASTLQKVRNTAPQSRTGAAAERRANIAGAYEILDSSAVTGKNVLLLDDIVTTGSTLSECARELKAAGAARVYGIAVARSELS